MKKTTKKTTRVDPKKKAARVPAARKAARGRGDSALLASVHDTVSGLHRAGVVGAQTMRKFDKLCLAPVEALGGKQIAQLRKREKVSQPVFALYLNVSKSSVSQWETGLKVPDTAAMKLLDLVKRKGLSVLA